MADYKSLHQYGTVLGFKNKYSPETLTRTRNVYFHLSGMAYNISSFKCYIPPYATGINITLFCGNDSFIKYALRKGQEPTINLKDNTQSHSDLNPFGFKLEDINKNVDCVGTNDQGYCRLLIDNSKNGSTGFWLYANMGAFNSTSSFKHVEYSIDIKTEEYIPWYNSTLWGSDGDPIGTSSTFTETFLTDASYQSIYQNNVTSIKGFKNLLTPETVNQTHGHYTISSNNLTKFRFFIPPGTTSIKAYSNCGQDAGSAVYFAVRKNQSPTKINKAATLDDGFKILDLNQDCYGVNSQGYVRYVIDNGLNIASGFWIYVLTETVNNIISNTHITYAFDIEKYQSWYNTVTWGSDGDPISSTILSDTVAIPESTGTGLSFVPASLDFRSIQVGVTGNTLRFLLTNISNGDIVINSIQLPEGFTYKFVNEFPAYQPYNFTSVYQSGVTYEYDDNGVYKEVTYTGFKNIFDYTNPIICCGKSISTCCNRIRSSAAESITLDINATNLMLKVYVPKGSNFFKFYLYTSPGSYIAAISRWKTPPEQYYEDENTGLYPLHYSSTGKLSLADLLQGDNNTCASSQNIIPIVDQTDDTYKSESGWIYIILRVGSGSILGAHLDSSVDMGFFPSITTYKTNGDPADEQPTTTSLTTSGNPTEYETMTDPYYRLPSKSITITGEYLNEIRISEGGSFEVKPELAGPDASSWRGYARIFIPPGATNINIIYGKSTISDASISKLGSIPTSSSFPVVVWTCRDTDGSVMDCGEFQKKFSTFDENGKLIHSADSSDGGGMTVDLDPSETRVKQPKTKISDCFSDIFSYNRQGKGHEIAQISIPSPGLSADQAGWFYIKLNGLGGGSSFYSSMHNNLCNVIVNADTFNDWWDNGGSNEDGSINWERDIESVETYYPKAYVATTKPGPSIYNPTTYYTVHSPYYKLPTTIERYTFIPRDEFILGENRLNDIRMFIPPGTVKINFFSVILLNNPKPFVLARHKIIPTSSSYPTNTSVYEGAKYTLTQLKNNDCYSTISSTGDRLYICEDSFESAALSVNDAGWLYMNSNGFQNTVFTIEVHVPTYNQWWTTYGSKQDKSIEWDVDVEGVETYSPISL